MKAYMGLSCKVGAYNRVLKELLDLKIPQGDIFLLFGPVDILIQFPELESLDEFKEKWFNWIRMIGAEEGFQFSGSELKEAANELKDENYAELPEEILERIAGGSPYNFT